MTAHHGTAWPIQDLNDFKCLWPNASREEIMSRFPGKSWDSLKKVAETFKIRRDFQHLPARIEAIRRSKIGDTNPMKRPEIRDKVAQSLKGKRNSPTTEIKRGERKSIATEFKKGIHPPTQFTVERLKLMWSDPAHRARISKRMKLLWSNPDYRTRIMEAVFKGLQAKPTKPEQTLIAIVEKYNLPYEYTGDGKVFVMGYCPDFMNVNGEKKILEVFGRVFHDPIKSFRQIPLQHTWEGRMALFQSFGWDCLIIWDDELDNEINVVQRIRKFTKKGKSLDERHLQNVSMS